MKLLRTLVILVIILAGFGHTAKAQPASIGEVDLPLQANAFSELAQCLNVDLDNPCNAWVRFFTFSPTSQVPWNGSLTGEHLGDVVVPYFDSLDNIRLVFKTPVRNLPGPDLYFAEAKFTTFPMNGGLGDMAFKFRGESVWRPINAANFTHDPTGGDTIVLFYDGSFWGMSYSNYYHLMDLSDYGVALGEVVREINISTPMFGIHLLAVANLNTPPLGDIDLDMDVDIADWQSMSGAFDSCLADSSYETLADLNQSGCIDLLDFAVIQTNFGTGILPPPGASISGATIIGNPTGATPSGAILMVMGPITTAIRTERISYGDYQYEIPDLPDGTYTIRPEMKSHLYLPYQAVVTVASNDISELNFDVYAMPGEPLEYEGIIVSIDPAVPSFRIIDSGGILRNYYPHIAAVYEGVALSFPELKTGMKAMGKYYNTSTGTASVKTEWP